MGRPRAGDEVKPQLSTRVDSKVKEEIDSIVGPFHGARSALVEQLIVMGLEQYKKKNPDIIEVSRKHRHEKRELSFHDSAHSLKRASNEPKGGR